MGMFDKVLGLAETRPARALVSAAVPVTLAGRINAAHDAAAKAARAVLENARQAGELLSQAKKQAGHGGWGDWLRANVRFSERTVQGYMKVAAGWDRLQEAVGKSAAVADLTIREALAMLARPKDTSVQDDPTEPTEDVAAKVVAPAPPPKPPVRPAGRRTRPEADRTPSLPPGAAAGHPVRREETLEYWRDRALALEAEVAALKAQVAELLAVVAGLRGKSGGDRRAEDEPGPEA